MGYGGTILIPRSPHGDLPLLDGEIVKPKQGHMLILLRDHVMKIQKWIVSLLCHAWAAGLCVRSVRIWILATRGHDGQSVSGEPSNACDLYLRGVQIEYQSEH
jgi:hypothetical protein